jgi:hypothetical protein
MAFDASRDGRRFNVLHYSFFSSRYEVWDEKGSRLLSGTLGAIANVTISADGRRIAVTDSNGVGVIDVPSGESVWHHECEKCLRISLSAEGTRLLTWSEKHLQLWDISQKMPVWSESSRVGTSSDTIDISPDGQQVLWTRGSSVFVHRVGDGSDAELRLEDAVHNAAFSSDGTRVAVVSFSAISVWVIGRSRPLWQVRNFSSVVQEVHWSSDDSALMVLYDSLGTSLLDSGTGERFANLTVSKPGAFATQEIVLPSLRYRISRGDGAWEMWPLPAPDEGPPRESLRRALSEAGLELRGVELVDAAPNPDPLASTRTGFN